MTATAQATTVQAGPVPLADSSRLWEVAGLENVHRPALARGLSARPRKLLHYVAVYGYALVSTDGQSLAAQQAELKSARCEKIFQEKVSGARSDRKQLARLMALLAKGDVLVVTRLDRLARSTRDLLNLLGTIAEKGAGFKSLRDTWADTTTAHGRLMLTVLGGLAEFERELIRTRTGEGRERAKERGGW